MSDTTTTPPAPAATPAKQKRRVRGRKCKACEFIDYKDIGMLRRFLSANGKIHSRKRGGTCQRCQRRIATAIKRARFMGIFSYTN